MRIARIFLLLGTLAVLGAAESGLTVKHLVGLDYPYLAYLAAEQGRVELVLTVGTDGAVRSVRTVSGPPLLADGAATKLKSWTFSPCSTESSLCEYAVSIQFILKGEPAFASQCKTEFDPPGRIVVTSQPARDMFD